MIIEMFPPVVLELQREIPRHPKLVAQLQTISPSAPLEEKAGIIFSYCGMEVDGLFYDEDLEALFNLAYWRLRKLG